MDNVLILEELERLKDLDGKAADQRQRNSLEVVVLYELVKVNREELERYDQVVSKEAVVLNLYDIVLVLWVLLLQMLQNSKLYSCLMLVSLFVLDDLDSNDLSSLMIHAFKGLAKTSLAQEVKHLVSEVNVVFQHHFVVTVFVIVAGVVQL